MYLQENTKVFEIKGAAKAALQLDLQASARQPELYTSWQLAVGLLGLNMRDDLKMKGLLRRRPACRAN